MPGDRASVQGADAAAFADELTPLLAAATRLAAGMLLDAAAAEDAVQEAAVRAWRRRANRRPGTDLAPWFLSIVANQCREVRRGRWWHVVRTADVAETRSRAADVASALDVRNALRGLGHHERLALVLRYYLDLRFEEVAAVAGCSLEAARSRVRRAEASLRAALDQPEEWA